MSRKAARVGRFLRQAEALAASLRRRDPIGAMGNYHGAGRDGERLNVLFVCSRNQWRSPTGEQVWRRHPAVDARSAGTSPNARHPVSLRDIEWAEVILVIEEKHKSRLVAAFRDALAGKPIH